MSIVWGSCCSNWRPTSATGACRWNVCKSRSISRVTYFFGSVLSSFPIHHPGHWYHSFSLFYQALYYVNFNFSTHKHACSYLEKYQWIFSSNKEWLLIVMNNISLLNWFGYSDWIFLQQNLPVHWQAAYGSKLWISNTGGGHIFFHLHGT